MPIGIYKRTEECNNAHKGWHHSDKMRKAARERFRGVRFSPKTEFKKGLIPHNKGIKCPQMSGEKGSGWKGGITPLVLQIRHCFEYRQWRSDVFTRDDFTCQKCGVRSGRLEADHYPKKFSTIFHENKIKSLEEALGCGEFWNINNGRTLHKECHRIKKIKL